MLALARSASANHVADNSIRRSAAGVFRFSLGRQRSKSGKLKTTSNNPTTTPTLAARRRCPPAHARPPLSPVNKHPITPLN